MANPKLDPYLNFNGNCAEAFKFYEKVLGGKIEMLMTFGNSPMAAQMPPGAADMIMHAKMTIDGQVLMGSDVPPGRTYEGIKGASLSLDFANPDLAKKAFTALAEGGTVGMPLEKTFWAEAFGMVTDRFGVSWLVGCEKLR